MFDLLPHLKSLISVPGLSGREAPVRQVIEAAWRPLTDELSVSRLGSLHALKRGSAPEPRPRILLAAHMDAIGLMVAGIEGEFLRLSGVGGVDIRVLPGQRVIVHGRADLPGLVVQPAAFLLPEAAQSGSVPLEFLLVDLGLPAAQLPALVRPGDLISFAQEPLDLSGETLAGRSIDNRASVAVLSLCLQALQPRAHLWDVWAVATVQEEISLGGAFTSAFAIRPQLAIAVDVTFARSPGLPEFRTYPLGKGPTIGIGPNVHPGLAQAMIDLADRLEIPYAVEYMPRHSGTDAFALQVVAEGIPALVIGLPLRYMHTPVELIALKDLGRAAHLLAEFIAQLDGQFMEKLSWDDQRK
jgi:putative aminopeptidase FrvX